MIEELLKKDRKLHDLGRIAGDRYEGILTPIYSKNKINDHIHDQFTVNSEIYIKKYQNTDYWEYLLKTAFKDNEINKFDEFVILDLGSGAGNTVIPILKMFNNSTVIATDMSIELLCNLKNFLELFYKNVGHNNYKLIQIDIHELNSIFKEGCFDIIIGGAILHHLYNPQEVLQQCYSVLNDNGIAFFFEPFEKGNMLLSVLYRLIIAQNKFHNDGIPSGVANIFEHLCNDFNIRSNISKNDDIFKLMDDKWLFSENYLRECSDKIGFKSCTFSPLTNNLKSYFETQTKTYLRLSIGFEYDDLPPWSRDIITIADVTFSDDAKRDLLTEGRIVLKK